MFNAWSQEERQKHIPTSLPFNSPPERPSCLITGALSRAECAALIASIPFQGQGYLSPEQIKFMYRERIVHRFMSIDSSLSKLFQQRITPYLPAEVDGMSLRGVSPEWRFLHYERDGYQSAHIDGRERRPGVPGESRLTLQLYLNDASEFEGGELVFFDPHSEQPCYVHRPQVSFITFIV